MSANPTTLLTRRSVRSRLGRSIAIGLAIAISVAFVVGSFVLADGMRKAFSTLFDQVSEGVDLEVQGTPAFGESSSGVTPPFPASVLSTVQGVTGVETAIPVVSRYAQIVDPQGDLIKTSGAPTLGISWNDDTDLNGVVLKDGAAPVGPDQVVIDKVTADKHDIAIGDTVQVITDTGKAPYQVTGFVGLGESDGFATATVAMFDFDTAVKVLGTGDMIDAVDIRIAPGADLGTVQQAIKDVLPPQTKVLTGAEVASQNKDNINSVVSIFGNILLTFAFVTLFVSAFIINNVFAISIGQRLRELALLRAVGASSKQVRRMIYIEAFVISLVATIVGIGLGILVAKGMLALFNASGAGFPSAGAILKPRTVVMAFVVGIGVAMLSVIVPARRASKIPPVAAMRPEVGFQSLDAGRFVLATVTTIVGAVLFLVGLLIRPGGTAGLIAMAGFGALLLFFGAAGLVALVAKPATRIIGAPVRRLSKISGRLGQENAGRVPRRTAASASALMIGVALVAASAVFAASLRTSFNKTLENTLQADFILTDTSFQGMPPAVADTLRSVPEISAVTPIRGFSMQITNHPDSGTKSVGVADPAALQQLVTIDLENGVTLADLTDNAIFVAADAAKTLGVAVGDPLEVTYQTGATATLTVAGVYRDASLVGNYLVNLTTAEPAIVQPVRDFFVVARKADNVTADKAQQAVERAVESFPQVKVESNAQFRESQSAQINQLLTIISTLLAFAIVIAVLGISITLGLSVLERTREIGLLRAVGMSRRSLRSAIRWEAIIVSLFGALVGLVLGTLIGIVLVTAVPNELISTIRVSPTVIAIILVGAVVAGAFAAWSPARRAAKLDVLRAITTE